MIRRQSWQSFLPVAVLIFLGFYVQSQLYLSPDVTWLLHVTKEMLAGKKYGTDIFETNPPMILWISVPAVLVQKIFQCDMHWVFLGYDYAITLLSLVMCFIFLDKAYPENITSIIGWVIPATLTASVLFLPQYAFGQRDVLWLILIFPWMGAAVCRLRHQPVSRSQAVIAGVLAGLGFSLKPYFLCVLCLVELSVMWDSRRLFGWWRIETALILGIFFVYLLGIAITQPGYFDTVLPLVMRYYFKSAIQPWRVILSLPWVLFAGTVAVYYLFFRADDHCPVLGRVLLLTLIGTLLSCVLARTPWFYHACPAVIMACVLLVYITVQIIQYGSGGWSSLYNVLIPLSMAGLMLSLPIVVLVRDLSKVSAFLEKQMAVSSQMRSEKKIGAALNAMSINGTTYTTILADFAHIRYASEVPFFWWYNGLVFSEMAHLQSDTQLSHDKAYLTDITAREIRQQKPQWLALHQSPNQQQVERIHKRHAIGWWHNLMLNPRLQDAFSCYRFYALSDQYRIYKRLEQC